MSKQKFLDLAKEMGIEPDPEDIPLDLEDFPDIVGITLNIFNMLRDTYIPGDIPIYNGKDLSGLPVLLEIEGITNITEKQFILKILTIFDSAAVLAARDRVKAARAKNKPPGTRIGKQ